MTNAEPGRSALKSFRIAEEPQRLDGGQGQAWIAGDVVLKPVDDAEEAIWIATVMSEIVESGFRVARPVKSVNDAWVENGWTAWQRVDGEHQLHGGPWGDVVKVCEQFHTAIADVERPAFFDDARNIFLRANRLTFGAVEYEHVPPVLADAIEQLRALLRPIKRVEQVIHGDFGGNVLFQPGLPPAVIDFSPNWGPPAYASAQALVDAVLWHGGSLELFGLLSDDVDCVQLIARAALYRLYVAGMHYGPGCTEPQNNARSALPIIEWLTQQAHN